MSFKGIVRELKEIREGVGNSSRRGDERKHWHHSNRSLVAPDLAPLELMCQGKWASLPPELLLDIIRRVEESETSWPARTVVISCASVCKSWRQITKEIVKPTEECGRITFPVSLKQPGPRNSPIQCFIRRDPPSSTYRLYFGLTPSEDEKNKLLLAAKRIRKATSAEFMISFVADDFSRASSTYVGKLKSNFLGTRFTMYDSQQPSDAAVQANSRPSRRFRTKQISPRVPACNYPVANISYELNVLRTRKPRRMHCVMHSIPLSSIQVGGIAPTPTSSLFSSEENFSLPKNWKGKYAVCDSSVLPRTFDPLDLRNKAPRWHEQLQCWCLNFKGRVTIASVKNFQLVATAEREKMILQFGKIGKDIFTMDYMYPLSAFQAFAICLSSFDTKPVGE